MKSITIELPNKERILMVEVPIEAKDCWLPEKEHPAIFWYNENRSFGDEELVYSTGIDLEIDLPKDWRNHIEILGYYTPQSGIDFPVKEEWVLTGSKDDMVAAFAYAIQVMNPKTKEEKFLNILKHHSEKQWPHDKNYFGDHKREDVENMFDNNGALVRVDEYKRTWRRAESKVMPSRLIVLLIK